MPAWAGPSNLLRFPILTIALILGLAFIMNYSGMSSTLGLAFTATGALFPFFSPFLGWVGVFLTGSDTSSNALFASLQKTTAQQIGVDPNLMVAANSSGGVTGKMISPQSIAVACAATGLVGEEGAIFRWTFFHSVGMCAIIAGAHPAPGLLVQVHAAVMIGDGPEEGEGRGDFRFFVEDSPALPANFPPSPL